MAGLERERKSAQSSQVKGAGAVFLHSGSQGPVLWMSCLNKPVPRTLGLQNIQPPALVFSLLVLYPVSIEDEFTPFTQVQRQWKPK